MTEPTYTLYSTTTCTRCPLARGSMERAGVKYVEYKLDTPGNEHLLEAMREELAQRKLPLTVPIVETGAGELLTNLATISGHFRELTAKAAA